MGIYADRGLKNVQYITNSLGARFGLIALIVRIYFGKRNNPDGGKCDRFFGWCFIVVVLLTLLYSDWILGAITSDFVGVPDKRNKALFWLDFAAKRLPLGSW